MNLLLRIDAVCENAIVWVGRIAAWVAIFLVIVIIFDVVTRRFFVLGSTKLQELEWHIHAVLFMFCLGYGYIKDTHVRIDLVRERLSTKTKQWIELIGCLFFMIPYSFIIIFHGVDWWQRSFELNEMSASATGLPYRWIIKAVLPIGFSILLVSAATTALRKSLQLFGPPDIQAIINEREKQEAVHLDKVDQIFIDKD